MWEKEQLFLTGVFQLITMERMMEIENHHYTNSIVTINCKQEIIKRWS